MLPFFFYQLLFVAVAGLRVVESGLRLGFGLPRRIVICALVVLVLGFVGVLGAILVIQLVVTMG